MEYITPKEAAAKWGISLRRVQVLCEQGRIGGAKRLGRVWSVPATAEKPVDARVKRGRRRETDPLSSIPNPPGNALLRTRLQDKIAPPGKKITYIHADAGYGKTTLLAQYAHERGDVLWLSLEEKDNDVFAFLQRLEKAARAILPQFDFHATDFIPLAGKDSFLPFVLSALLQAFNAQKLTVILDDTHVLNDDPACRRKGAGLRDDWKMLRLWRFAGQGLVRTLPDGGILFRGRFY